MKRILITLLAVVALLSSVAVVANAISINVTTSDYGEMLPTDAKFTKTTTTVRAYGNYDYLNFYINSVYDDKYFFYEIYADEEMKKPVASDYVYCETRGKYTYSPWIKLKGVFKTGTYYGVTYAAKIDDEGNVSVSQSSFQEFKFVVNRTTEFKRQIVLLKDATNTVNGPTIKWYKLSNNVSKYVVYRRSMTGTKWYKVATVNGNTYSYTDKSLKNKNAKYIYTVKAIDKKGVASRYQYNGATVLFAKAPVVSSVATVSDNRVQVKWNRTSSLAVYRVYRSENGGSWKYIKNNGSSNVFYDTTAKNGVTYKYTVRAVIPTAYGNAISSYYSGKATTFTAAPTLNPVEVSDNGLKITWGAVEGATAYTVYRKSLEKGASWGALKKVEAGVTEYVDTTANSESAFVYTVRSEGKDSRGSYINAGVEYFVLDKPIFTTEILDNSIYMKWNPIEVAEGYYILNKDNNGNWNVYSKVTEGNECVIDIGKAHVELQLTVQAFRGESVSDFEENVEKIDFWSATHFEYSVYSDKIVFKDGTSYYQTDYKLYRKLATQPDEAFELVAQNSYGGFGTVITDNSDIKYDVAYIYQIRMCYEGVEQYKNIQNIKITKYSPERYISEFDVIPKKTATTELGFIISEKYCFEFEKIKNTIAESFNEKIYIKQGNYWNELESTETWDLVDSIFYNLNNLVFAYVVCDENGSTPIDSVVVDKSNPEFGEFVSPTTNFNSNGLYIKWLDLEGVVEYKVEIYNDLCGGSALYETTIIDNDSKEYTVFLDYAKCINKNIDLRITAVSKNGNKTELEAWRVMQAKEPPVLLGANSNAPGKIQIKFTANYDAMDHVFVIFRKSENSNKWEKIAFSWPSDIDSGNGVFVFTDTKVESGVKYTYTVRTRNTGYGSGYVSYYDTKGVSAIAK